MNQNRGLPNIISKTPNSYWYLHGANKTSNPNPSNPICSRYYAYQEIPLVRSPTFFHHQHRNRYCLGSHKPKAWSWMLPSHDLRSCIPRQPAFHYISLRLLFPDLLHLTMNKKMLVIPCALFPVLYVAILFLHLHYYERILHRLSRRLNMTEKSVGIYRWKVWVHMEVWQKLVRFLDWVEIWKDS